MAGKLTVCSLNAEWMNRWYTSDADGPPKLRDEYAGADAAPERLAKTIEAIDPDVLALQEAPSREAELGLFVKDQLGDAYRFFLSDDGSQQKMALLYKPGAVDSAQLSPHTGLADLIDEWEADVDGDGVLDGYGFTRTPLVVDLEVSGHSLQAIVAHLKSNFINRGRTMWEAPATRHEYVVAALKNRRRISAEGMRLRRYLDRRLGEDAEAAIVVMGDLNDGPGLDYFEERYLTHNVTDILIGSAFAPEMLFEHAQHDVGADDRYTAEFVDFVPEPEAKKLLLDHILLSPGLTNSGGLRKVPGSGTVYHAEFEENTADVDGNRNERPTDHRPVGVELKL